MMFQTDNFQKAYIRPEEATIRQIFSPIIEELKNGNFSITRRKRKEELAKLLQINPQLVPIEFTNLVIKQLVEKKGILFSNELLEYVIKSLGHFLLKQNGKDCNIEVKEMVSWGVSDEKGISVKDEIVKNLKYGKVEAILTLFHEINHRLQPEVMQKNKFRYRSYEWQQDLILLEANPKYYDQNYNHIGVEIDSNLKAAFLLYRYLKEISPETAKRLKKKVLKECRTQIENKTQRRDLKFVISTKEELVDELLSQKTELLKNYPIFQFFYKEDGSKIPLAQILLDYQRVHNQKEQFESSHTPLDLGENTYFQELVARESFYRQILRYRTGSYKNVKEDYLSITVSDIPFLDQCVNDPWLEREREKLLTQYEKKYIYLALLREKRNLWEQGEMINEALQKIERIEMTPQRLNVLKRTLASIQFLKDAIIKEKLMKRVSIYIEPLEQQVEGSYRK